MGRVTCERIGLPYLRAGVHGRISPITRSASVLSILLALLMMRASLVVPSASTMKATVTVPCTFWRMQAGG